MRRLACSLVLVLLPVLLLAGEPKSKIVQDHWDAAYLEGGKAGFVHTTVVAYTRGDRTILRATTELNLTVKRFQDTINLRMETGNDETEEGKVTSVFMKQFLGKDQQAHMIGTVADDRLHVRVTGGRKLEKTIPWNSEVLGMYAQEKMVRDRKVKPGDELSYLSYEPTVTAVVTTKVAVKDFEMVEVRGAKKRLLRIESTPEKIKAENGEVQLPKLVTWLDNQYRTVRSQVEVPGLGNLTLNRVTKTEALGSLDGPRNIAKITDIGINQLIRINKRISEPYQTEYAVYRVTMKDDDNPSTAFARDGRQEIKNIKGNTFELHIKGIRDPQPVEKPIAVKKEFLKSNYFVNSDDDRVRKHAASAIGEETDAWERAKLIERWVHEHMENKNFTEAFATADHVAKTLEGDCTEHAVLSAAMCRAAGVPSRLAVGLLYVDTRGGPVMGFHMWTEVWAKGQWLPIDATMGRGYVGAAHLKIADHSWHDVQSMTPLLPVVRVLGKIKIDVIRVGAEE